MTSLQLDSKLLFAIMSSLLEFTKMNGAGNDFVMLDNRMGNLQLSAKQISLLCNRHRGVGADGLIMLEYLDHKIPYRMRYYNADGQEADMCGNGARCFTRFLASLESLSGALTFHTHAGMISGTVQDNHHVQILMSPPFDLQLDQVLTLSSGEKLKVHSLNTGVPHAVIITDNISTIPVSSLGRQIRHHTTFPAGTNVNFIQVNTPNTLSIRTYERGVEDETLACGTGIVAASLIYHFLSKLPSPIFVTTRGHDVLRVDFELAENPLSIDKVSLTGPADFVFKGTISI